MTNRTKNALGESLLRWEFSRTHQRVMCAIRAASANSWEVVTIPLWDVGRAAIESFSTAREALRRHAAIAAGLRDAGWKLSAYTG
jgi:hypothetical protein